MNDSGHLSDYFEWIKPMLQFFEVSVGSQDLFEVPVRLIALWGNFPADNRNFWV